MPATSASGERKAPKPSWNSQVVLWTGAVVWALADLLLLARAYPGGNLFTGAVTSNWRPEYLVLLGLPWPQPPPRRLS